MSWLPLELVITPNESQAENKLDFITALGAGNVVAIGNGRNDRKMIEKAAVGVALIQGEGGAMETLTAADLVAVNILDALDLLTHPHRLIVTLRS